MSKLNFKMLFGLFLISFGVFLEVFWIIFCFSSIIVGILLLIFAPSILFFPFNFFFALGMRTIGKEFRSKSNSNYYSYSFKFKSGSNYKHNYSHNNRSYTTHTTKSDMDRYYKILESNPSDSFDTIKKNYRRLIKKYHYDTLASQGLSEEELKKAEDKTKEINEAYSKIKEKFKNKN